MCFSPTASFTAGALLAGVGVSCVRRAPDRASMPLAAIPILFGIQQLTEGMVWLALLGVGDADRFTSQWAHLYALFAFALWPIYIPIAVLCLETQIWRRRLLWVLAALGQIVGLTLLWSLAQSDLRAEAQAGRIAYHFAMIGPSWGLWAYLAATCGALLASSRAFVRGRGVAMGASAALAWTLYQHAFPSTWCFFAALLSGSILLYVVPSLVRKDEPVRAEAA
jgi:hypothetical protein